MKGVIVMNKRTKKNLNKRMGFKTYQKYKNMDELVDLVMVVQSFDLCRNNRCYSMGSISMEDTSENCIFEEGDVIENIKSTKEI